jgi:hypothetical protein
VGLLKLETCLVAYMRSAAGDALPTTTAGVLLLSRSAAKSACTPARVCTGDSAVCPNTVAVNGLKCP